MDCIHQMSVLSSACLVQRYDDLHGRPERSKRFTVPRTKLYSDRPLALLAELSAEKPTTYNNLPVKSWPLPYWSQPICSITGKRPRRRPAAMSLAKPTVNFVFLWQSRPQTYWSQMLPFDDAAIALEMAGQPAAAQNPPRALFEASVAGRRDRATCGKMEAGSLRWHSQSGEGIQHYPI